MIVLFFSLLVRLACSTEPKLDIIKGPIFWNDNKLFNITIQWKDVVYMTEEDYITVNGCVDLDCIYPVAFYKTPIQYKYVNTHQQRASNAVYRLHNGLRYSHINLQEHVMDFTVIVRADIHAYQIAYVSGTRQYVEIDAISKPIKIPDEIRFAPKNVRLSIVSESQNAIRIMWTEPTLENPDELNSQVIVYSGNDKVQSVKPGLKYRFTAQDLCDPELYPAGSIGFSPLGTQVEAIVAGLEPNEKYSYRIKYELKNKVFLTELAEFVNMNYLSVEAVAKLGTRMVVFGDMGQSMDFIDHSLQHSFDNHNHGEVAAHFTITLLETLSQDKRIDVINHIGDISYATGQLSLWDTFMYEIENISSKIPWMVSIGNHEIGWRNSDIPGSDSQGECGVPYISLFPYSQRNVFQNDDPRKIKIIDKLSMNDFQAKLNSQKLIEPYYSYRLKNVYVIMMSTEHFMHPGSDQLLWIENELKTARNLIRDPEHSINWILFTGHRPMYISDKFVDASTRHLRKHVEPLLKEYGVDIAMWGHHHSYQRFKCKLYQGKCHESGIVQIVSGHAGFDHSPFSESTEYENLFAVKDNMNWGITLLDFVNNTHCKIEYIENQQAKVLDSFWVSKFDVNLRN